jgi:hypothetical protein
MPRVSAPSDQYGARSAGWMPPARVTTRSSAQHGALRIRLDRRQVLVEQPWQPVMTGVDHGGDRAKGFDRVAGHAGSSRSSNSTSDRPRRGPNAPRVPVGPRRAGLEAMPSWSKVRAMVRRDALARDPGSRATDLYFPPWSTGYHDILGVPRGASDADIAILPARSNGIRTSARRPGPMSGSRRSTRPIRSCPTGAAEPTPSDTPVSALAQTAGSAASRAVTCSTPSVRAHLALADAADCHLRRSAL